MKTDSVVVSIAMLKEVIAGKTYEAVATQYGVTRTAIERRVKAVARTICKEVGVDGINADGLAFVRRLRTRRDSIVTALQRYEPRTSQEKRIRRSDRR